MSTPFLLTLLQWFVAGLGAGVGAALVVVGVVYALNVDEKLDDMKPPRDWAGLS